MSKRHALLIILQKFSNIVAEVKRWMVGVRADGFWKLVLSKTFLFSAGIGPLQA